MGSEWAAPGLRILFAPHTAMSKDAEHRSHAEVWQRFAGKWAISTSRPGYSTVFCLSVVPLTRLYSPTFAAAFSRNSDPSRMYLRRVARDRWPVWAMMARSGTPAAAAAVARPARREWPA